MFKQGYFILLSTLVILEVINAAVRTKVKEKLKRNKKPQQAIPQFIDDSDIECGRTALTSQQTAKLEKDQMYPQRFPWTGVLLRRNGKEYTPHCIVTLIPDADEDSSSLVLTLSTCIRNHGQLTNYKVYFGSSFPVQRRCRELRSIKSIMTDKTSPNPAVGNAAVLTLSKPVQLNNRSQPVCLSKPSARMPENSSCVLSLLRGDGKDGKPEHYLIDVITRPNAYCKRIPGQSLLIDSKMEVCATDHRKGFFMAKGGALLCRSGKKWVQYGVYSHGSNIVDDLDYVYNSTMTGKEGAAAYISVSTFRMLMQNSQNLDALGRINLMRIR
uniref:Peptidase S1 domain-containing protein n=1 Tax=Trichuris muris TaxID=70415 RepID=A0A5S6R387_TRIMR